MEKAKIVYGDSDVELPVVHGTEGETALDVGRLRRDAGLLTYDPGFANTSPCKSAITYIDGDAGVLRYRGYPIEELAEKSTFLEVAWLLMFGELPTRAELHRFCDEVTHHTMLHEDYKRFIGALPKDAHPMPVAAAAVGALATFYPDPETDEAVRSSIVRLIAKMPTIAAHSYKHSIGQPFIYPSNELGYTTNFLNMMFATPCGPYEVDSTVAKALDLLLILHADHEQNCSTSTVRLVSSSRANLFSSISAGIYSLWGPLHGGANQAVIEMLEAIAAHTSAEEFLRRAKDKQDNSRLMGFGHRVYRSYDPRATILKKTCHDVIRAVGASSQLLDVAQELEAIALSDPYFIERKLYPNVDFYSGVIYQALGIPVNMFTVMFAMGRLPGWIAHWLELRQDPEFRIGRPRQVYVGASRREYQPLDQR